MANHAVPTFCGRHGKSSLLLLLILWLIAWLVIPPAAALSAGAALPPYIVSIPPRGTVQVAIRGHCLNYGLPFPGRELKASALADDPIRAAILYSLAQDYYSPAELYQTQWAIWHFTNQVDITGDKNKQAAEIVAQATKTKPTDLDAGSLSLIEAVENKLVLATIKDFKNISNPAYFGTGTLIITNLTESTQVIHLPYGMVFVDARQTGVQKMAIFPATLPQAGSDAVVQAASVCNQVSIRLPAKAATQILVNGHCLNYGLPFPGKVMVYKELGTEVIRNTICYNLARGYTKSDLWQAQLAVWRQTDKLDKGSQYPLVNEIAAYAESGVQPGDIGSDCLALSEAIEQGVATVTLDDFTNISDPAYFGQGTLVVTNQTDKEQTLCIPYGIVFKDAKQTGVQDMGIFPAQQPDPALVKSRTVAAAKVEDPRALLPASGAAPNLTAWFYLVPGLALLALGAWLRARSSSRP